MGLQATRTASLTRAGRGRSRISCRRTASKYLHVPARLARPTPFLQLLAGPTDPTSPIEAWRGTGSFSSTMRLARFFDPPLACCPPWRCTACSYNFTPRKNRQYVLGHSAGRVRVEINMGVKEGCEPRQDVRQGELDDAIFAASFGKLVRGEGPDTAAACFRTRVRGSRCVRPVLACASHLWTLLAS
jgi:hypothetical protein